MPYNRLYFSSRALINVSQWCYGIFFFCLLFLTSSSSRLLFLCSCLSSYSGILFDFFFFALSFIRVLFLCAMLLTLLLDWEFDDDADDGRNVRMMILFVVCHNIISVIFIVASVHNLCIYFFEKPTCDVYQQPRQQQHQFPLTSWIYVRMQGLLVALLFLSFYYCCCFL